MLRLERLAGRFGSTPFALAMAFLAATAAADGLPDYVRESEFLVDTPGTTGSVAGGLFNPGSWMVQRRAGLLFAWNDGAGDLTHDDFTGVIVSADNFLCSFLLLAALQSVVSFYSCKQGIPLVCQSHKGHSIRVDIPDT